MEHKDLLISTYESTILGLTISLKSLFIEKRNEILDHPLRRWSILSVYEKRLQRIEEILNQLDKLEYILQKRIS